MGRLKMDVLLVVLSLVLPDYFYFLQLPFVVALVYWYLVEVAWSVVKASIQASSGQFYMHVFHYNFSTTSLIYMLQ
jgi:hypothetical protein